MFRSIKIANIHVLCVLVLAVSYVVKNASLMSVQCWYATVPPVDKELNEMPPIIFLQMDSIYGARNAILIYQMLCFKLNRLTVPELEKL